MKAPTRARRRGRLGIAAVVAVAVATMLTACGSGGSGDSASAASGASGPSYPLVSKGTLTVAAYGSNGNEVILNPNGTLSGFIGEVLNGFAKSQGLKLKTFSTGFASALLAVQEHKADLMYDVFYSSERAKAVHYTDSFFQGPVEAFTSKDFSYKGLDSLKGHKVATVTGLVWTPYIQKAYGSDALVFPTTTAAAQALVNGQADAYINGASQFQTPPLSEHTGEFTAHAIQAGEVGIPGSLINNHSYMVVNCGDTGLANAYNKYVQGLVKAGTWNKMYDTAHILNDQRVTPQAPPTAGC